MDAGYAPEANFAAGSSYVTACATAGATISCSAFTSTATISTYFYYPAMTRLVINAKATTTAFSHYMMFESTSAVTAVSIGLGAASGYNNDLVKLYKVYGMDTTA